MRRLEIRVLCAPLPLVYSQRSNRLSQEVVGEHLLALLRGNSTENEERLRSTLNDVREFPPALMNIALSVKTVGYAPAGD